MVIPNPLLALLKLNSTMKRLLFFIILLNYTFSFGQEIHWADTVYSFSSEFIYDKYPGQYLAKEVLGKPSTLPNNKPNPCAWASKTQDGDGLEFIEVGFKKPVQASRVLINENFNAGSVKRVIITDVFKNKLTVYEADTNFLLEDGRLLDIAFQKPKNTIQSVRIELNSKDVKGFNQIDAVGLTLSKAPYAVEVNVNKNIQNQKIVIENLGAAINSTAADLSPVISPDGKILYFTRQDHPGNVVKEKQDVWYSELNADGAFQPAKNMGSPINNDGNNSVLAVTPDGQKLLLLNVYNPDGTNDTGLSYTTKGENGWKFPEKVIVENLYNKNKYGEYCLSNSGNIIVMTIERDDSEGSKDLYVSFKKEDGTWTEPKSMGPTVNSASSEISPYLAADERTLYFSSQGFPGYGGSDIFVSRRLDDSWTNWSEPENFGEPLNTPEFDAYYTFTASGDYTYFVSYREGSLGESDIFRASLPRELRPNPVVLVRGTVTNAKTAETISARINYYSLKTGKLVGEATSDPKTGAYQIILPSGDNYGFSASKTGFLPISSSIDLTNLSSYDEKVVDLKLVPIEKGASITINNVYFDIDKYDLRTESFVELNQLAKIIESNPTIKIEIAGHTDDQGQDAYNMDLSKNRANAVMAYLIKKGVAKDKISAIGSGESKPIVPNNSDENRQLNRRVEFKIIDL